MNERENLLVHTMEEASEVIQECTRLAAGVVQIASKALRFGLADVWEVQDKTNAERLSLELDDLAGVVIELREAGLIPPSDPRRIHAKRAKMKKYLEYSRTVGALAEAPGEQAVNSGEQVSIADAGAADKLGADTTQNDAKQ